MISIKAGLIRICVILTFKPAESFLSQDRMIWAVPMRNEHSRLVKDISSHHWAADDSTALNLGTQNSLDDLKLHNVKGIMCKEVDIPIETIGCVTILEGG